MKKEALLVAAVEWITWKESPNFAQHGGNNIIIQPRA
jgi:hypothetical protein